jgi:hypothetical protein
MTALISGWLPFSAAIAGETPPLRIHLYEVAEILCRLRQGKMDARQAGLLHAMIDHGVDLLMAGMTPKRDEDRVAGILMDAAFAIAYPTEFAFRLSAIRDGMTGN